MAPHSDPNATRVLFKLDGRKAVVTGCASGIGLATAERLARSGATVAMNDLREDALGEQVQRLAAQGLGVHAVPGDLGSAAGARAVATQARAQLGGLDYLINNAGAPFTRAPIDAGNFDALTDEFWERILRVNLLSAFWMTRELAPLLRAAGGAVVNTVSISAFFGGGSSAAYVAAKAALGALTREMARGLAPAVRVNGIAPGLVNSPWECSFGDLEAAARDAVPLQRVGQPEDYAELIVFLCAGGAYMTGQVIPIAGGLGI